MTSPKFLEFLQLPEGVTSYRKNGASMNEVLYRAAWARICLKRDGVLQATARGVWALTARGQRVTPDDLSALPGRVRKSRTPAQPNKPGEQSPEQEVAAEQSWQDDLLAILRALSPDGFERAVSARSARKRLHKGRGHGENWRWRDRRCRRLAYPTHQLSGVVSMQTLSRYCWCRCNS